MLMEREQAIYNREQAETQSIVGQYAQMFVQRWDTYARQRDHSRSYYRVLDRSNRPVPLAPETITAHLRGDITVGLYSVARDGLTRWSVIDSDEGLERLVGIRSALQRISVPSYLERSRAGGHLWVFWEKPLRPSIARKILSPYLHNLELFPAGDIPDEDGLGLLIRAPLGIHRATMHRYGFLSETQQPIVPGSLVRGQVEWLSEHVQRAHTEALVGNLPPGEPSATPPPRIVLPSVDRGPIAQWVAEHDIRKVVGQHVELDRCGLGHCPWPERHKHGDQHKSFVVFPSTQKWWCFTERTGGNAFDFLCRFSDVNASEMLKRIRHGELP